METIPINFNHVTVIRVTLLILGVAFTWYMGSVKNKSRVAWLIMVNHGLLCEYECFLFYFVGGNDSQGDSP